MMRSVFVDARHACRVSSGIALLVDRHQRRSGHPVRRPTTLQLSHCLMIEVTKQMPLPHVECYCGDTERHAIRPG